jgi:hypothetical protein
MSGTNGSNYAGNNINYDGLTNYSLLQAVDSLQQELITANAAVSAALASIASSLYLGAYQSAPVVNQAGAPLVVGNLYYDQTASELNSYNGTSWAPIAPLSSPAFTNVPTAPTAAPLTNSLQLATTAYADAIGNMATTNITTAVTTTTTALALKAPLASPVFTGTPVMPSAFITGATTDNSPTAATDYLLYYNATDGGLRKSLISAVTSSGVAGVGSWNGRTGSVAPASADYTVSQVTGAAPSASPALTGTPTAPTAAALTSNTQLATTAYADSAVSVLSGTFTTALALTAPLAAPAFTGVPTAPTAALSTNTTQLATTAFAVAQAATVPQNSKSANYTTVLSDAGKHILHPSTDATARTFTIDSNANVAYPLGTVISFVNYGGAITLAITADTMYLAGAGTAGSRTLAAYGEASALKTAPTVWLISGVGLT